VRPSVAQVTEHANVDVDVVPASATALLMSPPALAAVEVAPVAAKVFALKPVVAAVEQTEITLDDTDPEVTAEPQVATDAISPFEISGTLTPEPQTNSIVIAEIPDSSQMGDIVTDAGLILRTGSIEIVPVTTGQIDIIPESAEADVAESIDSAESFAPSLAPVRASGVLNSQSLVGARPVKRRFLDATITSVTLGIVILALAAAGVISFMLGILR